MKILNVFVNEALDIAGMFPNAEITAMSAGALRAKKPKDEYDVVVMAHSLQRLEPMDVPDTVKRLADAAKMLGEVWIITPSLEWATKESEKESPSPALHYVLCGGKDDPHRCGFTIMWLRSLMAEAGLVTRQARHDVYTVEMSGQPVQVLQNRVIGLKVIDDTAAAAISL